MWMSWVPEDDVKKIRMPCVRADEALKRTLTTYSMSMDEFATL